MSSRKERSYPWILRPFVALWDLLAFVLRLTGRLLGAILGFALMVIGILLSLDGCNLAGWDSTHHSRLPLDAPKRILSL
jgi:hypothetical protein